MSPEDELRIRVDGVVHVMSTDFDSITRCGTSATIVGANASEVEQRWMSQLTLDAANCIECLATIEETEVHFRCDCTWVGGDPDYHKGKPTCPACWRHDRKRRVVTASVP